MIEPCTNNQPTLTSFPALEASPLQPDGQDSAPSPSARSSPTARKLSRKNSTQFLPTLTVNGNNNRPTPDSTSRFGLQTALSSILTSDDLMDDVSEESLFSQQEFLANPQVAPEGVEARQMTAGSGRKLYESLVKHSRLGPCLKTLLGSLLLSQEWSSSLCYLNWRASATKSARRLLFQLVPSEPVIDGTESSLLPTLSAGELNGGGSPEETRRENGHHVRLRDVLKTMLPTLTTRDWRSEKSNQHEKNSRPLSEVIGLLPTLRANKRGVPDSHGNVQGWSGLKLTSAFCERFMGFPLGWTDIGETPHAASESTRSATRSSQCKSTRSSKL